MKKEKIECVCAKKTSIGGQALMEGIMMRGPKNTAMAVRNTKGEIVVEEFLTVGTKRPAICRWPVIRGIFGYIDSMTVGYRCLMRSAELSGLEDIVEESPKKKKKREAEEAARAAEAMTKAPVGEAPPATEEVSDAYLIDCESKATEKKDDKLPAWVMTATMVASVILAFALAIGLFAFLPTFLYELLAKNVGFLKSGNPALNSLIKSAFEGVMKILLLVGYMALISLMKDIRRTFMYHGAEHKTIFCYEAGLELTVENVRRQRRFHPRCGTSFLILMLLVGIFISFFIDPVSILIMDRTLPTLLRVAVKLLTLPLIVGIGYELIKLAGRHDNFFTRILSAPGVWLQRITVLEPTDDMIECAIEAMTRVIPSDNSDKY